MSGVCRCDPGPEGQHQPYCTAVSGDLWACGNCGWRWPLASWHEAADCDACGGEMHKLTDDPPEYDPDAEADRIAEQFAEARAELDQGL